MGCSCLLVNEKIEIYIKLKDIMQNLKSGYILQKIFNNLPLKKSLNLIKYNKKIKKRLKMNINNYKEYSEKYSSIELEILPVNHNYGQFINIKRGNEKYYHFYSNNDKKEIKRNYFKKNEKIKIIMDYHITSFDNLFSECKSIESINFKKFSNSNNMRFMFYRCKSLKELNLSNFNTDNVTDMSYMFRECSLLQKINLSNFNTSKVTNMHSMFYGCISLKELNPSNFMTNNLEDIGYMFFGCSLLNELNLSNFNTNKVINMESMFEGCSSLNELDLSNFNTIKANYTGDMFYGCSNQLLIKIKGKYKNIKEKIFDN